MKKMYWKAYSFRPAIMSLMAVVALLCLLFVETHKELVPQGNYDTKLKAALLSHKAFDTVKKRRLQLGLKIDKRFDPAETGLIGKKETSITSDHGVLRSKQISVDPNLAALIVQWLVDLKLKEGDVVAVGMTGSFPALDISTLAALNVMKIKPLIIVSGTASQWGANLPQYSWLDMFHTLNSKNVFTSKPLAASIGASKDLGKNLDTNGLNTILSTIKKYDIPLIREPTVSDSIDKRLKMYADAADGEEIKAYINIGGGIASIGRHFVKESLSKDQKELILSSRLKTGINSSMPVALANSNSVAIRYLKQGIPVINIKEVFKIAQDYNLQPWRAWMGIGVGTLFFHEKYNIFYAFISLLIIILACWWEMQLQLKQKKQEAAEQLV
jgi:poly-gamma-glutamate system protein